MCWGCVQEEFEAEGIEWDWDYPNPLPEAPAAYVPLMDKIWSFYQLPGCGVGGPLHVVLDDSNADDASVSYCKKAVEGDEHWSFKECSPDEADAVRSLGSDICSGLLAIESVAIRTLVIECANPYDAVPFSRR